jgi:hypothetical protein
LTADPRAFITCPALAADRGVEVRALLSRGLSLPEIARETEFS